MTYKHNGRLNPLGIKVHDIWPDGADDGEEFTVSHLYTNTRGDILVWTVEGICFWPHELGITVGDALEDGDE